MTERDREKLVRIGIGYLRARAGTDGLSVDGRRDPVGEAADAIEELYAPVHNRARRGTAREIFGYLDRDGYQWRWGSLLGQWCRGDGKDVARNVDALRKAHGPLRPLYAGPKEEADGR